MAPMDDDFVLTLSDNEDGFADELAETEAEPAPISNKKRKRESDVANLSKKDKKSKKQKKKQQQQQADSEDEEEQAAIDQDLDPEFEFQLGDGTTANMDDFDGWTAHNAAKNAGKRLVDIDDIIAKRRQDKKTDGEEEAEDEEEEVEFAGLSDDEDVLAEDAFGMGAAPGVEKDSEDEDEDEDEDKGSDVEDDSEAGDESDDESVAEHVPHPDDEESDASDVEEKEDAAEAEKRAAFFAPESNLDGDKDPAAKAVGSFQELNLSRPIIKGLSSVGFAAPTPIQHKAIPVALLGLSLIHI